MSNVRLQMASPLQATTPGMARKRSAWISAVFVIIWIVVAGLVYFGGPMWLVVVLGVAGSFLALKDRASIRGSARIAVLKSESDE